MTSPDVQVELRPPAWARAFVLAFPVIAFAFVLFVVEPGRGGGSWLSATGAFAVCSLLAWRLGGLAVVGTVSGVLYVRNHWSTRSVRREDVIEVAVARVQGAPNRSARLLLRDGSVLRLDVTERPAFLPGRRLEREAEEVRAWVSGRRPPA